MPKRIDFYFDFISPFAYLANVKLPGLAKKYGAVIHYHPIDVMLAKLAAGNYGPSNREIPGKAKYIRADRLRWASLYGVPMVPVLNSARALRMNAGTYYAVQQGRAEEYLKAGYHQVWGLGMNAEDDATLAALARELGWEPATFLAYVNSPKAQQQYADGQRDAQKRAVFGSPIMIVDDQMYWGNDRLDFLESYLATASQKPDDQKKQTTQR
jgi:2-hydroxychromene-2-carboxylate isomerase